MLLFGFIVNDQCFGIICEVPQAFCSPPAVDECEQALSSGFFERRLPFGVLSDALLLSPIPGLLFSFEANSVLFSADVRDRVQDAVQQVFDSLC